MAKQTWETKASNFKYAIVDAIKAKIKKHGTDEHTDVKLKLKKPFDCSGVETIYTVGARCWYSYNGYEYGYGVLSTEELASLADQVDEECKGLRVKKGK